MQLSLGNYQNGVKVPTLRRYRDATSPSGFKVKTGYRYVSGTGIPASTLNRFKTKQFIPSDKSIKKIAAFENRVKFAYLRASGVSKTEAMKARFYGFDEVRSILNSYMSQAQRHAEDTAKINYLTDMGVSPEIAEMGKDTTIGGVLNLAREYGTEKVRKGDDRLIKNEMERLKLYILSGFGNSDLSISDIEDIYGEENGSADPVEDLYALHSGANLGSDYDDEDDEE